MIPELGHLALWIALGVAAVLGVMPMVGAARGRADWMALARPSARLLFVLVAFAFVCLALSFVGNDFSVLNVATNSNRTLPLRSTLRAGSRPMIDRESTDLPDPDSPTMPSV